MKSSYYQKGHIYVKLSAHYTATVRNIEDFKYLLNDKNEEKSILEVIEVNDVEDAFEQEVRALIADYKAEHFEQEIAAQEKKEIKVSKRTAKAVNRMYKIFEVGHITFENEEKIEKIDKEIIALDEDDFDTTEIYETALDELFAEMKRLKRENEQLEKDRLKIEPKLIAYLVKNEIYTEAIFEAHLNKENQEIYVNTCARFEDHFEEIENQCAYFVDVDESVIVLHEEKDAERVEELRELNFTEVAGMCTASDLLKKYAAMTREALSK